MKLYHFPAPCPSSYYVNDLVTLYQGQDARLFLACLMIAYYFRRLDKIGRNVEEIRIMGGGIRASLEVVS